MENSKNSMLLRKFSDFCEEHPNMRFWQALREWSEADMILHEINGESIDTFLWTERMQDKP